MANAQAKNNAEILKAVIADPQKLKEGDTLEWAGLFPVEKVAAASFKYLGGMMVLEYASKLISKKSGKALSFFRNADGSWIRSKYRENFQRFTGKIGKGYDVHHTFPKADEFGGFFKNTGIDVDDPATQIWREATTHSSGKPSPSAAHLDLWRDFQKNNPNATKEQIINQRDIIENKIWGNTTGDFPTN